MIVEPGHGIGAQSARRGRALPMTRYVAFVTSSDFIKLSESRAKPRPPSGREFRDCTRVAWSFKGVVSALDFSFSCR